MGRFLVAAVLMLPAPALPAADLLITATSPAPLQAGPAEGPFSFTFNAPIERERLRVSGSGSSLRLAPAIGVGGLPVTLRFALEEDDTRLLLWPSVPLSQGQTYVITLEAGSSREAIRGGKDPTLRLREDQALNPLVFTVRDTTAPEVSWRAPAHEAAGVSVNARITVAFSEPMDPVSLDLASVPPAPWSSAWTSDRRILVLTHPTAQLVPRARYCLTLRANDFAGNPLGGGSGVSWCFETGEAGPPDVTPPRLLSVDPAPGAAGVSGDQPLLLGFDEPVDPLSLRVSLEQLDREWWVPVPVERLEPEPTGERVRVHAGALMEGPTTYRLTVLAAGDLAGNAWDPASSPLAQVTFTTRDRTPPELVCRSPANGSDLQPRAPGPLTARFSEPIRLGADAPVLKLRYLEGGSPTLTPDSATPAAPGVWIADCSGGGEAGWSPDGCSLTLLTQPDPQQADGAHLRPGCTLVLELTGVRDLAGNPLEESLQPAVWSLHVVDDSRPRLLSVLPEPGGLARADAPIVLVFSKAMRPSVRFECAGDFSAAADPVLFAITPDNRMVPVENQWSAKSTAWSEDRRVLTLRHAPFPAADQPVLHTLVLRAARDTDDRPLEGLLSTDAVPLQPLEWWVVGPPRLLRWEYQAPLDPERDLTSHGLLRDPLDLPGSPSSRTAWRDLREAAASGGVPRNAALRAHFSHAMCPTPPAAVESVGLEGGWSAAWDPSGLCLTLTPTAPVRPVRGFQGAAGLRLGSLTDSKGDPLPEHFEPLPLMPEVSVPGDADGDWRVTSWDVARALRALLRIATPGPEELRALDLHPPDTGQGPGDGAVTLGDLIGCLRLFIGLPA